MHEDNDIVKAFMHAFKGRIKDAIFDNMLHVSHPIILCSRLHE